MKIAVIGASGWVGGTVVGELLRRGHSSVTAIVRDPAKYTTQHERLSTARGDLSDAASIEKAVAGHDAVVASVASRKDGVPGFHQSAAHLLLAALPRAGVKRLLWVGGAGSLEIAPGVPLVSSPHFPAAYKTEALDQGEALSIFRASNAAVDWSFFSPPALIVPGQRTGKFRLGGDQLLANEKGESTISVDDYSVALVDELEKPRHIRARFTAAY